MSLGSLIPLCMARHDSVDVLPFPYLQIDELDTLHNADAVMSACNSLKIFCGRRDLDLR